ncbi:MAG: hypothetical protein QGF46_03550 [Planctomycetota bacterium]|jgi:hypothetical protein|nr:hypothetical protein [Planctomycetota bacterium]
MATRGEELQRQAQRKKALALILLLAITALVWSRTLFAGNNQTVVAVASVSPSVAAPVTPTIHPTAAGNSSKVVSYETAIKRLETWPKALNRKVFHGSIEELSPINTLLNTVMEDAADAAPEASDGAAESTQHPVDNDVMAIDINSFDVELSTTAILGNTAIAIIEGEKYQIGDQIELQFEGKSIRYEVSAIYSRRVVLRLGDHEYELKIANFENASKSLNTNTDSLPDQPVAD